MTFNRYILLAIAVLTISLSNFWIYWIYEYNFFIGELLIVVTVLLLLSSLPKKSKTAVALIFVILFILSSILLINHFDKNLFSISITESIRIRERQQFYGEELGKVYRNGIGIFYFDNLKVYFSKISNNFFSALDLGLYFSPGLLIEQGKYPLLFAPLFIMGFLSLLASIEMMPGIYFLIALCISSFTNLDSKLGPLLMFPFISLCIAIGSRKLLGKLKRKILNKIT